jgi:hypothetical protein
VYILMVYYKQAKFNYYGVPGEKLTKRREDRDGN